MINILTMFALKTIFFVLKLFEKSKVIYAEL